MRGPGRRFQKGKSGNPKGRPRNVSSLTALLREKIAQICEYDKQQRTWQEMIILATLRLAIEGNSSALREVWDRIDGKVTELIPEPEASYPAQIRVEFVEGPIKNPAALTRDGSLAPTTPEAERVVFHDNSLI
jgi:hypothetical protein